MRFDSSEQAGDSIIYDPSENSDRTVGRRILQDQDEDGRLRDRAAEIQQTKDEFIRQLNQARQLMINQGFCAAEPAYNAAQDFAHGFNKQVIKHEINSVENRLAVITDPSGRRALAKEEQDLKLLQNAEAICLANFGLAELRARRSAQGTIDLMQAAHLNPNLLADKDFQSHFVEIEQEIKQNQMEDQQLDGSSHQLPPDCEHGNLNKTNKSSEEEAKRARKEWEDTVSNLGGTAAGIAVNAGLALISKGSCGSALAQVAAVEGAVGKVAGAAYAAVTSKPAIVAINSLVSKPGILASGMAASILARYTIEKVAFHNKDVNVLSPDNIIPAVTNYLGMGAMVAEGQKMLKPKAAAEDDVKVLEHK